MGGQIKEVLDPVLLGKIAQFLTSSGFNPEIAGNSILLTKVGFSDQSVNLQIAIADLQGHKVVSFISNLDKYKTTFERVVLAAARGNSACHIAKFVVHELPLDHAHRFELRATTHLYADYLNEGELSSMAYLFIKELDEVDNELHDIMAGG
jgi:hypothetical protein